MKKPPIVRIVSLVMAVLLLVSSMGFVIVEHTCEMKGKSRSARLGHGETSSCCGAKASSADPLTGTKKAAGIQGNPCCKEKAVFTSVTAAVNPEVLTHEIAIADVPLAIVAYLVFKGSYFARDSQATDDPYAGPPPISASQHIALLCSWLI